MTELKDVFVFCALYAGFVVSVLYMTVSQRLQFKRIPRNNR